MSRNSKKQGWNPYTSDLQRFSVYPSIKMVEGRGIRVGDIIVVNVYDVDERGRGVVHYKDLKVIIPNATSGSRVKVKIVRVQGEVAFAHIIGVLSESSTEY
ncbi:MAG: deoxyribonuclease [Desulfurococcaceae archaeon]